MPIVESSRCLITYVKQEHSLSLTDLKLISCFTVSQVFTEEAIIFLKNAFHSSVYLKQTNCKNWRIRIIHHFCTGYSPLFGVYC